MKEISLSFVPRDHQRDLFEAIEEKGYKRAILVHHRRCLSGDSLILMADESHKKLKDVVVGDKVLCWGGLPFDEEPVVDTVKNVWKTGTKKTLHIKHKLTIPLICSEDHKFACFDEATFDEDKQTGEINWVNAGDLKKSHRVLWYDTNYCCWARSNCTITPSEPEELYDMETETHHNFIANGYLVHNSGKDVACWNLMIRQALMNANKTYVYCLPKFEQARDVIWNARLDNGRLFTVLFQKR
jgi:hypothetical protein